MAAFHQSPFWFCDLLLNIFQHIFGFFYKNHCWKYTERLIVVICSPSRNFLKKIRLSWVVEHVTTWLGRRDEREGVARSARPGPDSDQLHKPPNKKQNDVSILSFPTSPDGFKFSHKFSMKLRLVSYCVTAAVLALTPEKLLSFGNCLLACLI